MAWPPAVLAGVNPVHGLYASFAGPLAGGFSASTTADGDHDHERGRACGGLRASKASTAGPRPRRLFLLTFLAGAVMVVAGMLRLGRYTRFVSHSVMIGFLTGVAVNIIFGQIPDLVGVEAEGQLRGGQGLDVLIHPGASTSPSLLVGLGALVIADARPDSAPIDQRASRAVGADHV